MLLTRSWRDRPCSHRPCRCTWTFWRREPRSPTSTYFFNNHWEYWDFLCQKSTNTWDIKPTMKGRIRITGWWFKNVWFFVVFKSDCDAGPTWVSSDPFPSLRFFLTNPNWLIFFGSGQLGARLKRRWVSWSVWLIFLGLDWTLSATWRSPLLTLASGGNHPKHG